MKPLYLKFLTLHITEFNGWFYTQDGPAYYHLGYMVIVIRTTQDRSVNSTTCGLP